MAHNIVKPQILAAAAAELVYGEMDIVNLFSKHSVEDFVGAEDDTLNMSVPGVLPFHDYEWRNNRAEPIQMDEYAERKISVQFGGNVYSASPLKDEQRDFDTTSTGTVESKILAAQARAVGRGLQRRAVNELESGEFEVTVGIADEQGQSISRALVEARRVLNRFHAPSAGRFLVVGSDFDAAIQNADLFNIASNVGDVLAAPALQEAVIGRWKEFTIFHSAEIASDAAYALTAGGFVFLNAAPSVPQSVGYGATASYEDVAVRVMKDYDPMFLRDRIITNTYAGFDQVKDPLAYFDGRNEKVSESEYFLRGVKLGLGIESEYPEADSELAKATGVKAAATGGGSGNG